MQQRAAAVKQHNRHEVVAWKIPKQLTINLRQRTSHHSTGSISSIGTRSNATATTASATNATPTTASATNGAES